MYAETARTSRSSRGLPNNGRHEIKGCNLSGFRYDLLLMIAMVVEISGKVPTGEEILNLKTLPKSNPFSGRVCVRVAHEPYKFNL